MPLAYSDLVTSTFSGIPPQAFNFYQRLIANNTREWWTAHKSEYEQYVREPMLALLAELEAEFGTGHMFRPHRDTRFAKDKTPIKEHQGAVVEIEDAMGYYMQISASGLTIGGGWYSAQGQQMQRYRNAVESPVVVELERMLAQLGRKFTIDGDPVKTRPRGVAADHPKLELMRFRRVTAMREYSADDWVRTAKTLNAVRSDWRALRPLVEFLADQVGPAEEPGRE